MAAQEKMRRLLEMLILLSTGVRRSKKEISRHTGLSIRTVERFNHLFYDVEIFVSHSKNKPHRGGVTGFNILRHIALL